MTIDGDTLNFFGAVLGAAITVWGSFRVISYNDRRRAARDKANLLSFLAILETRLNFASSDELFAEFVAARDVPGFINRCALVVEMRDLLGSPAVAEAAEGYEQLYTLHRLRRQLTVWSPEYAPYADIPYTDFYKLSAPDKFYEAVEKLIVPTNIIRGSVHLYIATISGRNAVIEEIKNQNQGALPQWDPDRPFIPDHHIAPLDPSPIAR